MNHEIRTPLNGVIGMADIILDTHFDSEQHDFVDSLKRSADSMLLLINDILDFSKIKAGKIELENINFNLRLTLEYLNDLMAFKADEKDIEYIFNKFPVMFKGDPGRIRHILTNLIENTIKFVKKGEISVSVSLKKETASHVFLLFNVSDTGIGIPKSKISRLFKSFSQIDASTTRKFGGTGLGLSISKQLTELMGGKIDIESEMGKGSSFWFTVKLIKQEINNIHEQIMVPSEIKNLKVLVVDSNVSICLMFSEYLKILECNVSFADNEERAINKLKQAVQNNTPFNLVISALKIVNIVGDKLCSKIKNDTDLSDTKLILATTFRKMKIAKKIRLQGISEVISKPVKLPNLLNSIEKTLDLIDSESEENSKNAKNETPEPFKKLNILLAEDNEMNQKVVLNMLNRMGHSVTIANNGTEAVEVYSENNFDLILMDIQMPEMSGVEATEKIRKMEKNNNAKDKKIPIIALTANAMKGDRERYLKVGMDDYISKPIKKRIFEKIIVQCVK